MPIFFQFSFFIGGLIPLLLGVFIYLQNKKEPLNKAYLGLSLCSAIWSFGFFALLSSSTLETAYYWRWFMESGSILIPAFWLNFVLIFLNLAKKKRGILMFGYVISIALWLLNLIDFFVHGIFAIEIVKKGIFNFYPTAGIGYILFFIFFFGTVFYTLRELAKSYKTSDGIRSQQIKFLIAAASFGFGGGGMTFLFTFNIPVMPYGIILFALYPVIIAYTITAHRLFDIRVIATELLTAGIWIFVLARVFFADTAKEQFLDGGLLLVLVIFGFLLISSVRKEVAQREKLEELSKKLADANEELKKLDRAKSEFISLASHQLRAPLTIIKGYTSMILEGTMGEISQTVRDALEKTYTSGEQLIKLIASLLDLSRIESGKIRYEFKPTNFVELVKKVLGEFKGNADQEGVTLVFENKAEKLSLLSLDSDKIREAVVNLVDNAIKYTVPATPVAIVLEEKREGFVRFSVRDQGIGIKKEDLKKLFTKFNRTDEARAQDPNGMGIGLYFVKRVIEDHGGRVGVESEGIGKGSTFFVELPIK